MLTYPWHILSKKLVSFGFVWTISNWSLQKILSILLASESCFSLGSWKSCPDSSNAQLPATNPHWRPSTTSTRFYLIFTCGATYAGPGVDFIKVGPTAQIIEIALSICALHLRRTIMPVKSFSKVRRYALRRAPNFMKSTPDIWTCSVFKWLWLVLTN